MLQQLLKITEVAEILQISDKSAKRLVDSGKIPAIRLGQRTVRVPQEKLERFIKQQCQSVAVERNGSPTLKSARKELDELLGPDRKPEKLKVISGGNS